MSDNSIVNALEPTTDEGFEEIKKINWVPDFPTENHRRLFLEKASGHESIDTKKGVTEKGRTSISVSYEEAPKKLASPATKPASPAKSFSDSYNSPKKEERHEPKDYSYTQQYTYQQYPTNNWIKNG